MACRVAIDELHNTQTAYLGADPALPQAVVVDKQGVIVFLGDPTDYRMHVDVDGRRRHPPA